MRPVTAAAGRPAEATVTPGCGEVVEGGVDGFLVPAGDAAALAAALDRLISAPRERRAMGKLARDRFEADFGTNNVVHSTLKVYRELRPNDSKIDRWVVVRVRIYHSKAERLFRRTGARAN